MLYTNGKLKATRQPAACIKVRLGSEIDALKSQMEAAN